MAVPKPTVFRSGHLLKSENEEAIKNVTSGKAKRNPAIVISDEKAKVINNCLILAAEGGFAVKTGSRKFSLAGSHLIHAQVGADCGLPKTRLGCIVQDIETSPL